MTDRLKQRRSVLWADVPGDLRLSADWLRGLFYGIHGHFPNDDWIAWAMGGPCVAAVWRGSSYGRYGRCKNTPLLAGRTVCHDHLMLVCGCEEIAA